MNGCRSFVTCKEGTTIFMVIHAFYENFYIQPSFKYSKKGLACKRCWFSVATWNDTVSLPVNNFFMIFTTQNMNSKTFLTFSNKVIIVGNTAMVTTECCTFGTKVWKLTAMLLLKNFYHTAQFINDGHGLNFFGHWTWHDRRLVMSWSLNIGTQCALEKW